MDSRLSRACRRNLQGHDLEDLTTDHARVEHGGVRVERPDLALVQDAEDRVGEKADAPPAQSRHGPSHSTPTRGCSLSWSLSSPDGAIPDELSVYKVAVGIWLKDRHRSALSSVRVAQCGVIRSCLLQSGTRYFGDIDDKVWKGSGGDLVAPS